MTELQWSTIRATGTDAATFLDGQLSQSVLGLTVDTWTLILEPDGVVVSSGVLRPAKLGIELLVPRELAEQSLARLRRFLLRVDCALALEDSVENPPLHTSDELLERRRPWVNEFARNLTPHSFGQHLVTETVSFTKGCFTGQELVGRMDARGATMPWRLAIVRGPSTEQINHAVMSVGPDGPRGVTTAFNDVTAYAIVHRSFIERNPDPAVFAELVE